MLDWYVISEILTDCELAEAIPQIEASLSPACRLPMSDGLTDGEPTAIEGRCMTNDDFFPPLPPAEPGQTWWYAVIKPLQWQQGVLVDKT